MSEAAVILFLAALLLVATWFLLTRLHESTDQDESEALLDRLAQPAVQATLQALAADVAAHEHDPEAYVAEALLSRQPGTYQQAAGLLEEGVRLIRQAVPGHAMQLQDVALLTRTVAFIVPLSPLGPFLFRSWRMSGPAGFGLALRTFLSTRWERSRLRCLMARQAVRVALTSVQSTPREHRGRTGDLPRAAAHATWQRVKGLIEELQSGEGRTLDITRQLVLVLDASRRQRLGLPTPAN